MRFIVSFDNEATEAVADSYSTMAALIAGDTAGYRCRLLELRLGPADDAPVDLEMGVQIARIDDLSVGTAGTKGNNPTPAQRDSLSRASIITAGTAYTAEPTTYGDPLWQIDLHRHRSVIETWDSIDAYICNRDQVLGLLIAPRTAAAARVSGSLLFEEF